MSSLLAWTSLALLASDVLESCSTWAPIDSAQLVGHPQWTLGMSSPRLQKPAFIFANVFPAQPVQSSVHRFNPSFASIGNRSSAFPLHQNDLNFIPSMKASSASLQSVVEIFVAGRASKNGIADTLLSDSSSERENMPKLVKRGLIPLEARSSSLEEDLVSDFIRRDPMLTPEASNRPNQSSKSVSGAITSLGKAVKAATSAVAQDIGKASRSDAASVLTGGPGNIHSVTTSIARGVRQSKVVNLIDESTKKLENKIERYGSHRPNYGPPPSTPPQPYPPSYYYSGHPPSGYYYPPPPHHHPTPNVHYGFPQPVPPAGAYQGYYGYHPGHYPPAQPPSHSSQGSSTAYNSAPPSPRDFNLGESSANPDHSTS